MSLLNIFSIRLGLSQFCSRSWRVIIIFWQISKFIIVGLFLLKNIALALFRFSGPVGTRMVQTRYVSPIEYQITFNSKDAALAFENCMQIPANDELRMLPLLQQNTNWVIESQWFVNGYQFNNGSRGSSSDTHQLMTHSRSNFQVSKSILVMSTREDVAECTIGFGLSSDSISSNYSLTYTNAQEDSGTLFFRVLNGLYNTKGWYNEYHDLLSNAVHVCDIVPPLLNQENAASYIQYGSNMCTWDEQYTTLGKIVAILKLFFDIVSLTDSSILGSQFMYTLWVLKSRSLNIPSSNLIKFSSFFYLNHPASLLLMLSESLLLINNCKLAGLLIAASSSSISHVFMYGELFRMWTIYHRLFGYICQPNSVMSGSIKVRQEIVDPNPSISKGDIKSNCIIPTSSIKLSPKKNYVVSVMNVMLSSMLALWYLLPMLLKYRTNISKESNIRVLMPQGGLVWYGASNISAVTSATTYKWYGRWFLAYLLLTGIFICISTLVTNMILYLLSITIEIDNNSLLQCQHLQSSKFIYQTSKSNTDKDKIHLSYLQPQGYTLLENNIIVKSAPCGFILSCLANKQHKLSYLKLTPVSMPTFKSASRELEVLVVNAQPVPCPEFICILSVVRVIHNISIS